jgi:hypothetical protein
MQPNNEAARSAIKQVDILARDFTALCGLNLQSEVNAIFLGTMAEMALCLISLLAEIPEWQAQAQESLAKFEAELSAAGVSRERYQGWIAEAERLTNKTLNPLGAQDAAALSRHPIPVH